MTVTIPMWLLWLIGVPLGLFLLVCLVIGILVFFNPPRPFG